MSIVDCQNYPKEKRKAGVCINCKYYRAKLQPASKRYGCSGYCISEKVANAFRYGYGLDGAIYMPVMKNGSCDSYEEERADDKH